jgi:hypothetical protein
VLVTVTAVGIYQKYIFSVQLFIDGLFISHSLINEMPSQTADLASAVFGIKMVCNLVKNIGDSCTDLVKQRLVLI